jgi:hypothetical protein
MTGLALHCALIKDELKVNDGRIFTLLGVQLMT